MNNQNDQQRRDKWRIVQELNTLGAKFTSATVCKCPFHDDAHASAGIYSDESGVWRFKCQVCDIAPMDLIDLQAKNTGKSAEEIVREMGDDSKPPAQKQQAKKKPVKFDSLPELRKFYEERGTVEAVYEYTNPQTKAIDLIVVRYIPRGEDRKRFAQAHFDSTGKIVLTKPDGKLPLFNRGRVSKCETVIVVEGEKCVLELTKLDLFKHGIAATTSPMGAGKAHYADWSRLSGKQVYIWADNDENGFKHAESVVEILTRLNPRPEIHRIDVQSMNLPSKGDAVDFLEQIEDDIEEKTKAVCNAILVNSSKVSGIQKLEDRYNQIIGGEWKTHPFFEFPTLSYMGRLLFPSSITCILGDPGAGKSFLNLQTWAAWNLRNIPSACFMLECDKEYHLGRKLAQLARNSNLTDTEWIQRNPRSIADALFEHSEQLESLSPKLWDSPNDMPKLEDICDWIADRVKEGFEILSIDPITAADPGKEPWDSEKKFLRDARKIIESKGARLIIYTHPRLQQSKNTLSNIASSAAYPRFSDNVLRIIKHDSAMRATVFARELGATVMEFSRAFHFGKTRNGIGDGAYIAAEHRVDDLRFQELGVVTSKIEKLEEISTTKLETVREHSDKRMSDQTLF